jgi:predicted O-methyltransferase YrrM
MYSWPRLAQKYLHYYLKASNGKGHGIHSPFVFDFVSRVLNDPLAYPEYISIEKLRRQLMRDRRLLEMEDMGAGGMDACHAGAGDTGAGMAGGKAARVIRQRRVANIAADAAKTAKWGQLLFRIARHYHPQTILELGTSLGLSTAYLAAGAREAKVITIEGAESAASIARSNFQSLGLIKVDILVGNFDHLLANALERTGRVDFAFVDGNHRLEPTLRYFNSLLLHASPSAVLIFDDIHWSRGMEEAWQSIKMDSRVYLTIDLFFIGLVFLRDEFRVKQHFTIRF